MSDEPIEIVLKRELFKWLSTTPPVDGTRRVESPGIAYSTSTNRRKENQDRVIYAQFSSRYEANCFTLMAVLDGIGGMLEGGRCAEIAISSILSDLVFLKRSKNRIALVEALSRANAEVYHSYGGRGGATFAGVVIEQNRMHFVNIGDSRSYRYSYNRGLTRHSSDDHLGAQLGKIAGLEDVILAPEIANRLGQYLGMFGQVYPNVNHIEARPLHKGGEYILLTTDGADAVGSRFISDAFSQSNDPKAIVDAIVKHASTKDYADNATAICAQTAILLHNREGTRPLFEHLKVWSSQGIFHMMLSDALTKSVIKTKGGQEMKRPKVQRKKPKSAKVTSKASLLTEHPAKADTSKSRKPEVIIQQLSLGEDKAHETTE